MKISSGISEINFFPVHTKTETVEKAYTWPVYNNGRVEKITGVTKRLESNAIYSKPAPEDKVTLLDLVNDQKSYSYSETGKLNRKMYTLSPGSFFDALA